MSNALPRIGDDVVLAVAGRSRVAARVVSLGAAHVTLDLKERLDVLPNELGRARLVLEFVNDDGLSRLAGGAEGAVSRTPGTDTGHGRLVMAFRGNPQLLQRRAARERLALPLVIRPVGRPGAPAARATALHLADEGLSATGVPCEPGGAFTFELALPDDDRVVTGRFVVEHVDADGEVSVRFTEVDDECRGPLRRVAYALRAGA